jgi:hypothetical protein
VEKIPFSKFLVELSAPSVEENQGLSIVEGSAPFKTEENPASSIGVRRAEHVGAPVIVGVMAHSVKERDERRKFLEMVRTWTNWSKLALRSGWRIVAARGGAEPQEDAMRRNSRKRRNGDTPLGYSGRTALRREQCNGFVQSIGRQRLDKHLAIRARNNRTNVIVRC